MATKMNFNESTIHDSYLQEIARYRPLSPQKEQELAVRIQRGDLKARNELIRSNLRFVINVAKKYENQGVPLSDLINEGNMGLIKAAQRFDARKNFKFITYGVWWVRQSILQALANQSRMFRVPENKVGKLYKLLKREEAFAQKHGRFPHTEEIVREAHLQQQHTDDIARLFTRPRSFDAQISVDEKGNLYDVLADESQQTPEELATRDILQTLVKNVLNNLSPKERIAVSLYYGIIDNVPYKLDEIGKILKISRERVRQLKDQGLKKIRQMEGSHALLEYIS
ncbi:MAG: sigma-70 family RNA polymerase sigma factor [Chitinivibrionales bacterium]|nr:sigma-70 family RNA polymerase sigma factor [Chitinivibrionales bacterium]